VQVGTVALGGHPPRSIEVRGPEDFEQAEAEMTRWRPDVLLVEPNALNFASRARIAAFTAEHRIPAMYGLGTFMDTDGLMAYGPSLSEHYHRVAAYVDKILKGTKPTELPIEQPTKFELVINLKTAKALGITIPPHLLVLADKVIQ
jgi:putative ABC transport system substrate-binding protein